MKLTDLLDITFKPTQARTCPRPPSSCGSSFRRWVLCDAPARCSTRYGIVGECRRPSPRFRPLLMYGGRQTATWCRPSSPNVWAPRLCDMWAAPPSHGASVSWGFGTFSSSCLAGPCSLTSRTACSTRTLRPAQVCRPRGHLRGSRQADVPLFVACRADSKRDRRRHRAISRPRHLVSSVLSSAPERSQGVESPQ